MIHPARASFLCMFFVGLLNAFSLEAASTQSRMITQPSEQKMTPGQKRVAIFCSSVVVGAVVALCVWRCLKKSTKKAAAIKKSEGTEVQPSEGPAHVAVSDTEVISRARNYIYKWGRLLSSPDDITVDLRAGKGAGTGANGSLCMEKARAVISHCYTLDYDSCKQALNAVDIEFFDAYLNHLSLELSDIKSCRADLLSLIFVTSDPNAPNKRAAVQRFDTDLEKIEGCFNKTIDSLKQYVSLIEELKNYYNRTEKGSDTLAGFLWQMDYGLVLYLKNAFKIADAPRGAAELHALVEKVIRYPFSQGAPAQGHPAGSGYDTVRVKHPDRLDGMRTIRAGAFQAPGDVAQ